MSIGDVTGFSPQAELARVGLKIERQQKQAEAEVVKSAVEDAKQIGASSGDRGKVVDIKV